MVIYKEYFSITSGKKNISMKSIEVIMKMGVQWGRGRVWGGGGCQGGCERERRIEVIVKIQKKNRGRGVRSGQVECERRIERHFWSGCRESVWMWLVGRGVGSGVGLGGQGGCERRSEVIVKIQRKTNRSGGVGRIRLGGQGGCERRICYCENAKEKKVRGVRSGRGWGVEGWVGRGGGLVGSN